ncbi:MAG: DUF6356 family protein [bacterium]|nr:hypothetical protein [Gammaproteobacteria bacterium]HIL96424.1 hypothetical protein [Pseudomonadales bacterium]
MWERFFLEHPASVGESYPEHFWTAMSFSIRLASAALMCGIHAFLPFMFTSSGSRMITLLHDEMVLHRAHSVASKSR